MALTMNSTTLIPRRDVVGKELDAVEVVHPPRYRRGTSRRDDGSAPRRHHHHGGGDH